MRRSAATLLKPTMRLFLLAQFVLALVGCSSSPTSAENQTVKVAAAADLRFAFADVVEELSRTHPNLKVEVTYASSGSFYAQLRNRADFDLFLSADVDYPHRLAEDALGTEKAPFVYAVGHLAVWVPRNSRLDVERDGLRVVLDPSVRKVAIANPQLAPYGRAAEAALKSAGLYEQVKDRLVLGENITQAAQFAQMGAADVGILSLSLARAPALRDAGKYQEVPANACPRIEQAGLVLKGARNRAGAEAVRDFLLGAQGQTILKRSGFTSPSP